MVLASREVIKRQEPEGHFLLWGTVAMVKEHDGTKWMLETVLQPVSLEWTLGRIPGYSFVGRIPIKSSKLFPY